MMWIDVSSAKQFLDSMNLFNADLDFKQVRPLILAGGLSTRMGQPKHLLMLPNGDTLLQHIIGQIVTACPWTDTVYISLRRTDSCQRWFPSISIQGKVISTVIVYDDQLDEQPDDRAAGSLGPAAGMVAAYRLDPSATFLVIACDFPLLSSAAIQHLLSSYRAPVTCYQNDDGFCEPLFALWSSNALSRLYQNMSNGLRGPSQVVKQLSSHLIKPLAGKEECLRNTNTPSEWQEALRMMTRSP